ncbi:MFS transporter [Burkholderia oklahomensis]|uniref:D-galactonate transporter family protein n=1 Tax=Burkholderia oklahomensis TaxID=342113 RepID=A0AAI8B756_9BURK|nr:MFS transporter [Burkholderia oklahomensis]AIO66941.1 D-galactonate transporter family protein [Burkholderia oklahomensis]AJX30975.1 D-galactonate transporter family protein [Burkholderia oklahomensis C6786]AOI43893.1 glucarate transporter [Burkholderia oklahomensis EO147]AOI47485.1 glucarate transporter [Burkholderia oklahomensis C6786]KUY49534.1 glucarate transporter [Burkholderia oklahomensis EO147]
MDIKAPAVGARSVPRVERVSRVRFMILAMLFVVTTINYADRATISIAGAAMQKDLGIDAVSLGYIFSAFGWAYVIAQIPGGWLLDRFGSRRVYAASILMWSIFTLAQGAIGFFSGMAAIAIVFALRFLVGIAEAPSFPANSRIVAAWFPANERGTASAIFNSAQYAATVIFAPLMAWLVNTFGWHYVFVVMGVIGVAAAFAWRLFVRDPKDHPRITRAEIEYIENGGGLVNMDRAGVSKAEGPDLGYIKQLLKNRMMMGVYVAQYCINALTYFFITWFPVYLVQARGMSILKAGFVASVPAVCGFLGGILGGLISDALLRRGASLSVARKVPIVLGMLLSISMVVCNYVDTQAIVVAVMALSFFGKGMGALGWAVNSDTAPKQIAGLSGALMNTFGNLSSITTPIAIGYIVNRTGSFNGALVYVGLHALVACVCYLFVVGEIRRVELKPAS